MGRTLIDEVRRRYRPGDALVLWRAAVRRSPAERFAARVASRWEDAAGMLLAHLEELERQEVRGSGARAQRPAGESRGEKSRSVEGAGTAPARPARRLAPPADRPSGAGPLPAATDLGSANGPCGRPAAAAAEGGGAAHPAPPSGAAKPGEGEPRTHPGGEPPRRDVSRRPLALPAGEDGVEGGAARRVRAEGDGRPGDLAPRRGRPGEAQEARPACAGRPEAGSQPAGERSSRPAASGWPRAPRRSGAASQSAGEPEDLERFFPGEADVAAGGAPGADREPGVRVPFGGRGDSWPRRESSGAQGGGDLAASWAEFRRREQALRQWQGMGF